MRKSCVVFCCRPLQKARTGVINNAKLGAATALVALPHHINFGYIGDGRTSECYTHPFRETC